MCRWQPSSRDIYSQPRMSLSLKVFSSVMCEARVVFIYANDNGEASKMKILLCNRKSPMRLYAKAWGR